MRAGLTFEEEFDELYDLFALEMGGEQLLRLNGIHPEQIDVGYMSHKYHTDKVQDISVDANANANGRKSINNYQSEITKGVLKLEGYYLLWRYTKKRLGRERANELLWKIWSGELYFHDASGANIQIPYCWAFSTTPIMIEGRPYGQLHSTRPKRADSFMAQVIEATMDMSQDFAGAVAPSDLIVNYCYYAKKEQLQDYQVLNDLQKFVHVMNNGFRVGGQSPFVNLSLFDRPNLEKVFGELIYPDGSSPDFDYITHVQQLFGEWFAKGDPSNGLPYRFPVVTLNIHKDENGDIIDRGFLKWAARVNKNLGCFNIYINDGYKVATCCRLVNDRSKLRPDTFGNGGLNLGAHRVVAVNLPNVAYIAKARAGIMRFNQAPLSLIMPALLEELEDRLVAAKDLLMVHREEILRRRIRDGICKFFNPLEWFDSDDLFSVVGIVGIYEMVDALGYSILDEQGQRIVEEVLQYIEKRLQDFTDETGYPFSCEEIPGEQAAVKLAEMDNAAGFIDAEKYQMYSNQYVPLIVEADMMTRIEIAGRFQSMVSGGGILHINVDSQIVTEEQMESIIIAAVKAGVQHFAINYGFGVCEHGHVVIVGNGIICPECGGKIRDYLTRVIGYFTLVSAWNKVRREFEFHERKFVGGQL
jgi:anaerobic ribonucleoside-triphosphate reductase